MKGFEKSTYWFVQFVYSDYSDYCETFEIEWKPKDMIEYMRETEYNQHKEETGKEIQEIYVNRVSKFSKDMWY